MHKRSFHDAFHAARMVTLLTSGALAVGLNASARLPGRKLPRKEQIPPFGRSSGSL